MSRSLRIYLAPFERVEQEENPMGAWDCLDFQQDQDLFDVIEALPTQALPLGLEKFGEAGLETLADNDGEPIPFVRAKQWRDLNSRFFRGDTWNAALLEFLYRLPKETRVVLWWH